MDFLFEKYDCFVTVSNFEISIFLRIGYEIARRLGMEGSAVAITGRNEQRLKSALERLKAYNVNCIGIQGHAGKKEHRESLVKTTLDKFGGVDILVNSAGVNPLNSTITKIEESKFDHIMGVNVKAPFHLTQLCLDSMKHRGGGSVINISSVASIYPNCVSGNTMPLFSFFIKCSSSCSQYPEFPLYGVAKSALNSMCEHMSAELGESNVRINTLVCGYFPTKFASIVSRASNLEIGLWFSKANLLLSGHGK